MELLRATPGLLKQANLTRLRRELRNRGTATRAELAGATGISATTVRALLEELLAGGEIERAGCGASSGGRRAERYRLAPSRYYGAAVCITGREAHALVVDMRGAVVETAPLALADDDFAKTLLPVLDEMTARRQIRAIGVGVPGAADGGGFWRGEASGTLRRVPLGEELARRYGVPVVLENDVNATAIGFGRCYEAEFPTEDPEDTNMAYVYFKDTCVSAGLLAGGRVIRGCRRFAGELGLVPHGEGTVDEWLAAAADAHTYTARVVEMLSWLCGLLNPQYIALGGPAFRRECLGPIGDGLTALLPQPLAPELLDAGDLWHDYHSGMAFLTAERMFSEVRLIQR